MAFNKILVVGGGTSGWLTAAYLAKRIGGLDPSSVQISLVESSDIAPLGVGEGTIPTIRRTLSALGVDEAEFMYECSATFKQGIKFVDWVNNPKTNSQNFYYHPFELPKNDDLAAYWMSGCAGDSVFSAAVTGQSLVCEAGLGPKLATDPGFNGRLNYAYHLDVGKLADFLKKVSKRLGVSHHIKTIEQIKRDQAGNIAGLVASDGSELAADLYIDCTGFSAQLIGKSLEVPFIDKSDVLFVNSALAMQVPYGESDHAVPPFTVSTAHEAGWTWDIALANRRGIGYVYSDNYTDDNRAEAVLRNYIGDAAKDLTARKLKLKVGYRQKHWVKNCVAIGLSGGFLEPLESTGIMMIEVAVQMLATMFERNGDMALARTRFNESMSKRYEHTIDFIKLHYFLTKRTDSAFWLDNAKSETAPDSLVDKVAMWRERPICGFDLSQDFDVFNVGNHQFILYGMDMMTKLQGNYPYSDFARKEFARIAASTQRAIAELPGHNDLLKAIYSKAQRAQQAGR